MIRLRRTTCVHPDFQLLIRALDRDLRATNGDEAQDLLDQFNIITDIDTVVVVYDEDRRPVARETASCRSFSISLSLPEGRYTADVRFR